MKGYIDRIEDGDMAVILLEEQSKQFTVPLSSLPKGTQVGSWLDITLENDQIVEMVFAKETTEEKRNEANNLLAKLRAKSSGSRFKQQS